MDPWIRDLLRCPRCGGRLVGLPEGPVTCGDATCALSEEQFPVVGGQMALIDFDQSVVDRQALIGRDARSVIPRSRGGLRPRITRAIRGRNRCAARHAKKLLDRLRERGRHQTLLVIGGGSVGDGAEDLYAAQDVRRVGFDIYASPHTDFVADAQRIPLADGSVDAVWIQAVLEHVVDPFQVVDQIARVLRAGGVVYAETPFMQQVHEGAYDFMRFSESGHRWLFRRFSMIGSGVVLGPGTATVWSLRHLLTALVRHRLLAELLVLPFAWIRLLDRVVGGRAAANAASAVFFYGAKEGDALTPKDLVAFFDREPET